MIDTIALVCYGIFGISMACILFFGLGIIINNKKKNKRNHSEDIEYYEE